MLPHQPQSPSQPQDSSGTLGITNSHLSLPPPSADTSEGAFTKGSQWLVWKFESDATLGDALDGRLGPFPACLEEFMFQVGRGCKGVGVLTCGPACVGRTAKAGDECATGAQQSLITCVHV